MERRRKIVDPGEAAETPAGGDEAANATPRVKGVVFVKNQVNELLKFKDGTTYKFQNSREVHTDPVLIENIRSVAAQSGIFESES